MSRVKPAVSLSAWFTESEFIEAEAEAEMLILKLTPEGQDRVFSDPEFREKLVAEAKGLGFSRLVTELFPRP